MYKYIILFICVSGVICDLNKPEGAACEFEGANGKCVEETRCFTSLAKRETPHPVCTMKGDVKIICCGDCELVNNTKLVVMSPRTGFFWKDGRGKARDHCLDYIDKLPYRCREGGFYSGIGRSLNAEKKCHTTGFWGVGGAPPPGYEPGAEYPHQVLLGYGDSLQTAKWLAGGSIISDRFILTAAHTSFSHHGQLKFVALGVKHRSDPITAWQTHTIKRFVAHPEYKTPNKYHDIALIETKTIITFNKDVLPACLHVKGVDTDKAITTTWRDLTGTDSNKMADTIQTINVEKFTDEECRTSYPTNRHLRTGVDTETQMCYGSKTNGPITCRGFSGEPLLVSNQFDCIYAVIGVTSFGSHCGPQSVKPDVYTKVAHYVPWIESVVWP